MKFRNHHFRIRPFLISCACLVIISIGALSDEPKSKISPAPETPSHEDDKAHGSKETGHSHDGDEHADGGEHEEEEARATVGPDKGVTAFSEHEGFKLSPEAKAAFGIRSIPLPSSGRLKLPKASLVLSGATTSIFRIRQESYRRVSVKLLTRASALASCSRNGHRGRRRSRPFPLVRNETQLYD